MTLIYKFAQRVRVPQYVGYIKPVIIDLLLVPELFYIICGLWGKAHGSFRSFCCFHNLPFWRLFCVIETHLTLNCMAFVSLRPCASASTPYIFPSSSRFVFICWSWLLHLFKWSMSIYIFWGGGYGFNYPLISNLD